MSNNLQNETSPYLKQHQNNPVNWYPWGEEAFTEAKAANKLVIVSIGYSACHWCHVMERESFENAGVAAVMNADFVSIKVDREERPDIDQIYMTAVQLMTNSGGWPLHCICLPDGRPIYGGTYFRPDDWKNVLGQLQQMWMNEPNVAFDYADRLTQGIRTSEQLNIRRAPESYSITDLNEIVNPWRAMFDKREGGLQRAPKFPMPNNWLFLLRYGYLSNDKEILAHTHFTLRSMASGGIYDHVGGGFARYAIDSHWHVPHFEKMLYDNAQLVSLFAEAYAQQPDPLYKRVVEETLAWVSREMTADTGGFYAALDADSEGVEGKFYTFNKKEIEEVLGEDAALFVEYFSITPEGNWEDEGINVLKTAIDADRLAVDAGYSSEEWAIYLGQIKAKLLAYRSKRVRPGLDDKILTSWNALMIKGFVDAYRVFNEERYLQTAIKNANYILNTLQTDEGVLLHQPASATKKIEGFLDDYAFTIDALIALYEATFDITWLDHAKKLVNYVLTHFYDSSAAAFYYTSDVAEVLIARKFEIMDNVIPASNSVIIHQLNKLGLLFDIPRYKMISAQVLANVFPQIKRYGSAYSNWSIRLLEEVYGVYEIAVTGPECVPLRKQIDQRYLPNKIILGGNEEGLPLLIGRINEHTKVFVCKNNTCSLPVDNLRDFEKLIFEPEIEKG
ncbi:thioredoxin domain-containing protein [Olivibacter sp. SDN3]|uniref:thioredoxin domain-containing protein n=1 Tax=Olivibacter sp. SDN3 TaxID=2764720 RepID=UPI001650FCE2|nr:thioredoxin domain-containing protein [Olivibacter sp. SDN3]QNL48708.1 thioredoxin domain-containing protein [Olivibacter sp. SDN3]